MPRFAIEPVLMPLLRTMHIEARGEGPVVAMRLQPLWAADLRKHLTAAGIKRKALFETDDTRKAPAHARAIRIPADCGGGG